MSKNLRVLLLGTDQAVADLARCLSSEYQKNECYHVQLENQRTMTLSAPLYSKHTITFSEAGIIAFGDEFVERINFSDCDAVVFAMEILPYLNLSYPFDAVKIFREKKRLKKVIAEKGVLIVTDSGAFGKAQKEKKICSSFIDWMKTKTGIEAALFREVQERCLLLSVNGSREVVAKQRVDLVHMIDAQILGGDHYTNVRILEAEQRHKATEKQLSVLGKKITKETLDLSKTVRSLAQKLQEVDARVTELTKDTLIKHQESEKQIKRIRRKLTSQPSTNEIPPQHPEERISALEARLRLLDEHKFETREGFREMETQLAKNAEEIEKLREDHRRLLASSLFERIKALLRGRSRIRSHGFAYLLLLIACLCLVVFELMKVFSH